MENRVTIEVFLQNFKRSSKTVYKPRKAKKQELEFVVEGDDDPVVVQEEAVVPKVKKQTIRKPKTIVAAELETQGGEEKQESSAALLPPLVADVLAIQKQTASVQPKLQSVQEESGQELAGPPVGADEMIFEVNEDTLKRQKRTTRGKKKVVLKRSRKNSPLIMSAIPEATAEEKEE